MEQVLVEQTMFLLVEVLFKQAQVESVHLYYKQVLLVVMEQQVLLVQQDIFQVVEVLGVEELLQTEMQVLADQVVEEQEL